MKKNYFNNLIFYAVITVVFSLILVFTVVKLISIVKKDNLKTENIPVRSIDSEILAEGTVRSQNEVTLHFQTGGKLVYLPFKEGDFVASGQIIASLDQYMIQKQLEAALNSYRSTRDSFDQLQDNSENNYLNAQQSNPYPLNYFNLSGIGGNDKVNAVNDMIKRLIDQSQANLDNSVIQVQLANYAFTLASINSPINGVLLHEDVNTTNQIVSPQTSFIIIDPTTLVFKANITESDINYIQIGSVANIKLNGLQDKVISGTVIKIYPDKISLPTGENVYQVDIQSDQIESLGKYKQGGIALIKNSLDKNLILVPSWLVLSQQYIWVTENNEAKLKKIKIGETFAGNTEVLSGLQRNDKIILNPKNLIGKHYPIE